MSDAADLFVSKSASLLTDEFLPKLARSTDALSDADIWWRPNEVSNSIGNLLLHLSGNVTQWILGGVGQRPFTRERQKEFDARHGPPKATLLADLTRVVHDACGVITAQTASTLIERRTIQTRDVTVLEAIYHVVEHFSMHTGQVILIAKSRTGIDLGLWRRPSP